MTHLPLNARRTGLAMEKSFVWICRVAVFLPLALLLWLIGGVVATGVGRLSAGFLSAGPSADPLIAGIWPALMGSLWLIALTAVIALPLGVASAVYLEEYSKRNRFAATVEVSIANLAGVPSIIYGMLGLGLFVRALALGPSVIAGALTLALLVLPVVILSSREALRTVPLSLREAALGLGATRWQVVRRIVLPSALPGILTGSILAISRAIGETAPLVLVGAVAFVSQAPDGLDSPYTALPIQIYNWTSMPQRAFLVDAAAGIVVLMATLLVLNSVAIVVRNRYQKRL